MAFRYLATAENIELEGFVHFFNQPRYRGWLALLLYLLPSLSLRCGNHDEHEKSTHTKLGCGQRDHLRISFADSFPG